MYVPVIVNVYRFVIVSVPEEAEEDLFVTVCILMTDYLIVRFPGYECVLVLMKELETVWELVNECAHVTGTVPLMTNVSLTVYSHALEAVPEDVSIQEPG